MVQDKKFAAAAIIGFIAAVLLFCVAMTLLGRAEKLSSSSSKSGMTSAFTKQGNFVIALMPDPNADVIFDDIMLCEGNVNDKGFAPCHDAISLPVPEELQ